VRTKSCCALLTIFVDFHRLSLSVAVFLATKLKIYHITGYDIGNKDSKPIDFHEGFSFCCNIGDENFFEEWERFLFASHK